MSGQAKQNLIKLSYFKTLAYKCLLSPAATIVVRCLFHLEKSELCAP